MQMSAIEDQLVATGGLTATVIVVARMVISYLKVREAPVNNAVTAIAEDIHDLKLIIDERLPKK